MGLVPICLFSHLRGRLIRSPRRCYGVPALCRPTSISQSGQVEKEGKFKVKALEINETGVLQVLTGLKDRPYRALSFLKRIEGNRDLLCVQAYATVIRILCSCSCRLDQKLDQLLMELIKKGDDARGFSVRDLLNAIEEQEEEGEGEGSSSLLLSRLCGSLVRAYANLNMFGQAIDMYCYSLPCTRSLNFIITRMNACGEYNMALFTFRKYGSAVIDADTRVLVVQAYRKVIIGLCHEMKIDDAEELVDEMEKKRGIAKDVCVYSAIIAGYRKIMNFPRALQFFDDVVVQNGEKMKINRVIASSILECCCHMGKFEEAYDLFVQFRDLKVSLDRVCYNVAFDALVKLGKTQEAVELFRGMTRQGIAPDVINYTTLIGGCCAHGEVDQALDLVMEMEKEGKTPDLVTYNVLAGGLARNGHVEGVNRTLELMESRGVKPTNVTYNIVIQGLVVAGKTEEADTYSDDKSPGNGASFIKGYCETGCLDEAFEQYIKLDFPLPKNVYFILVNSLCASDAHHIYKAQLVLNRMDKLGVEPGKSMRGIIIGAWCRVRNTKNAWRNFKALISRGIIPDKYTYTTMINSYCMMGQFDKAYELFQDMKKSRVVVDSATYTTMIQDHIPEELESRMKSEMEALGIEPDAQYYTVLLHRECMIGKIENAEKIFRQMEPDDVAYAALINGCCKNNCADKAQKLIHEMVEKGMTPLEPCMVTYVILKQEMVEHERMTPSEACEDLVEHERMTLSEACEDLYLIIHEMMEKGMRPSKACMDVYVILKQEMVEKEMMTLAKAACEDLYLLIHEMMEKGMRPPEACMDLYVTLIGKMVENEVEQPPEACKYLYVIFIQEMVDKGMTLEKSCKEVYLTLFKEMMVVVENEMRPPEACIDLYVELICERVEKGLRIPKAYMDLYVELTQGTVENGME